MARKTTTSTTKKRSATKAAAAVEMVEDPPPPAAGLRGLIIRRVPIGSIKAAKYNPRRDLKPGDADYEKLRHSIRRFGYVDPLIWNEATGNLVGGHQRLKVLREEEGVTEVDVSVVNLGDADEKALNIALNKVGGDWDNPRLLDLLLELQRTPEADFSSTGFDDLELRALIAEVEGDGSAGDGGADDKSDADLDGSSQIGDGIAFRIIVDCDSERHQRELLKRFEQEGLECRALMS